MKRFIQMAVIIAVTTITALIHAADLPIPEPPQIAAGGYILLDFDSGKVLAELNAEQRMEPASLTKIMTAYVVFHELAAGNLKLTDEVPVSEKAWRTGGSRMFIEVGARIRVEDLIQGMIIQSGNDASVALAEHIAGSESTFADLMNSHAKRLGMSHSHFINVTGLPGDDHYSTPRDIATLTRALIRDFPQYYHWYSQKEFFYNGIKQPNRNRLLSQDPTVDGVKTGFTNNAGYCLVSSAKRDGQRMIAVVMKTPSPAIRARDSLALLNYGFRFFESQVLFTANKPVDTVRVWKGLQPQVSVGVSEDVSVLIQRGKAGQLTTHIEKPPELFAPVAAGDVIGEVSVRLGETEMKRVPLVALEEVALGGWWRRLVDTITRWIE